MGGYVLEVAWGCPSEKYPLNGVFQFDQASALKDIGDDVVYAAIDMRSIRKWRHFGINRRMWGNVDVIEYNFPFGPLFPKIRHTVEKICFNTLIRKIIKIYGVPGCIHIHNCEVALCAADFCRRHNIQYIITEHSSPIKGSINIEKKKQQTYRNAKCVIAVSSSLSQKIFDLYGIKTIVIPNIVKMGVPETRFRHNEHIKDGLFYFISAARLVVGKGLDILLEAFALLLSERENCRLEIMGDGPEKDNLIEKTKSLKIDEKVFFYGAYSREEFSNHLQHSDCFVLPSRSETFGIVYIEAMSHGNPVIATRCGGPEDFIDDSNGVLVDVDDINALRDAMTFMLINVENYNRSEISISCKSRFSPDVVARRIDSVIYGKCS